MKGPTRPRSGSPRGMETIGLDIGETNKRNLAQKRIKRGECPKCGVRTHKIGMFGKKTPLTVKGECVYGRCLRCNPVEGYQVRPPPPAQALPATTTTTTATSNLPVPDMGVGRDIIVDDDDSVVSGITMDAALQGSSARWMSGFDPMENVMEESDPPPPLIRRPNASICDDGEFHPANPNRMDSIGLFDSAPQSGRSSRRSSQHSSSDRGPRSKPNDVAPSSRLPKMPSRRVSAHYTNAATLRVPSDIQEEEEALSYPALTPVTNSNEGEEDLPYGHLHSSNEEEKKEIQALSESMRDESWRNEDPNLAMIGAGTSRMDIRQKHMKTPREQMEISFVPDGQPALADGRRSSGHTSQGQRSARRMSSPIDRPVRHVSPSDRAHKPTKSSRQAADLQFIPDSEDDVLNRKLRTPPNHHMHGSKRPSIPRDTVPSPPLFKQSTNHREPKTSHRKVGHPKSAATASDIGKIPEIIHKLGSRGADSTMRAEAFEQLAQLVWRYGDEGKVAVQENRGVESVVESMWEDLGDANVQTEAVNLLFALSASSEDGMGRDIFLRGKGNAIDALLISMQTHISVESLQISGCGALGCLASASNENEQVDDGTLSGAVSCVVAAMDAHRLSVDIQKWGLWALYCQCVLSHSAEANQINLAKGTGEAGGMDVILRAMQVNEIDLVALGWACKLYWSLSFSEEIVGILTQSNKTIHAILRVLRSHQGIVEAADLVEAAYGALANIAREKGSHGWLRECGIITRVFESMDMYHSIEGVNIEACALLANLTETQPLKEAVLSYGVVKMFRALQRFPDSVELHDEALRCMLSLSVGSEEGKATLSTQENLKLLIHAVVRQQGSISVQESGFALIASLCVAKSIGRVDLSDVVQLLIRAMLRFADQRKLQESACLLLRNLSCRDEELVMESDDFFPAVLNVMKNQADSESVLLNLCCMLSNLLSKEEGVVCCKFDEGMNQLVSIIQSNMESAGVLEMACSALWNLIAGSEECKQSMIDTGGVEYVKTVLLMHPESPRTLEMACGVLACLSGSPSHAGLVSEGQGISLVVETMQAHSVSLVLLEYASLMLRNLVLDNTQNAAEASRGISTILAALKDNPDATAFQIEACNALWVMAAHCEDCRQKILALDGPVVLMGLMDNDDVHVDAREVAQGAFGQLEIQAPSSSS